MFYLFSSLNLRKFAITLVNAKQHETIENHKIDYESRERFS